MPVDIEFYDTDQSQDEALPYDSQYSINAIYRDDAVFDRALLALRVAKTDGLPAFTWYSTVDVETFAEAVADVHGDDIRADVTFGDLPADEDQGYESDFAAVMNDGRFPTQVASLDLIGDDIFLNWSDDSYEMLTGDVVPDDVDADITDYANLDWDQRDGLNELHLVSPLHDPKYNSMNARCAPGDFAPIYVETAPADVSAENVLDRTLPYIPTN